MLQIKDLESSQDHLQIIKLPIAEKYLETDQVPVDIHQWVIDLIDQILEIEDKVGADLGEAKADLKIGLGLNQVPMGENQGLCHLKEVTQMREMKNVKFVAVGTLQSNAPFILMESVQLVELAKVFTDLICVLIEV